MQVELMEKEGTEMKVKIVGEGHSFTNVLRKKLHEDERIEIASYNIDHPLLSDPVLRVKTSEKKSPKRALIRAAKSLSEEYEEIKMKLEKALEQ
ncbi:hypothetical protein AKJ37_01255 [candidate division MSBL1 archaeon SCGC-AAA259I09]|uniref:DNA-directed RNA polymerase subunit Rpo11 n=2 Tax=candidate division MSBL1 TaxID=215777 RepID=A0A133UVC7_9EURY|nr:hypothetical protein AKJ37_01255 [candidate division MSBL1 archaeon SCGC-AAA259I09]KXB00804.1 hypothetical protein AKJ40_00505 [candidate division MSBL1 archaeon SCGC-AAA259M10]